MLVVDTNVLVYAANGAAREHGIARAWLRSALSGGESVGFAWNVLIAYVRLTTHPSVLERPLGVDVAARDVESWLAAPNAMTIEPTARHIPLLTRLLLDTGQAGNLVPDAHLAALALEHSAAVATFDRDFARFEGLRIVRPDA